MWHVIRQVRIKLASTWKILRLLLLAANDPKSQHTRLRHPQQKEAYRYQEDLSEARFEQSVFASLKKAISLPSSLDQADCGGKLLVSVLQEVVSQPYIHTFPCRAEFWEKFKASDTMAELCKALGGL